MPEHPNTKHDSFNTKNKCQEIDNYMMSSQPQTDQRAQTTIKKVT